ncbi:MAG: GNAT family N-acetyltransferase [Thermomicrobiales bacterium]
MTAPTHDSRRTTHDFAPQHIEVVRAVTPADRLAVFEIRRRVFAEEQDVADLRVADPDDERSIIALAFLRSPGPANTQRPVATGRLTPPRFTGDPALVAWVATVPEARGHGAGGAVMRFLLDAADRTGAREVALAAQFHAEDFYLRLGFIQAGPIYDVRGIPHRRMIRRRG